jgi:hypothetical protein
LSNIALNFEKIFKIFQNFKFLALCDLQTAGRGRDCTAPDRFVFIIGKFSEKKKSYGTLLRILHCRQILAQEFHPRFRLYGRRKARFVRQDKKPATIFV